MPARLPIAASMLLAATAAWAGPAADLVESFYHPVGFEPAPEKRALFVDPARAVFAKHDATAEDGSVGCIDFVLAIDAQDFDQETVDRTLKLEEAVNGDRAEVTARFKLFPVGDGAPREIVWSLRKVGGSWKVADIASLTNDWQLSEFGCEPVQ